MGKMKNVSQSDIEAALAKSDEFLGEMFDIINRMEKGYCDPLAKPNELARNFAQIARASADMVSKILLHASMQEDKADLERLLRERKAAEENRA